MMLTETSLTLRSTFQPDASRHDLDEMRSAVLSQRYTVAAEALEHCGRLNRTARQSTLSDELLSILSRRSEISLAVLDDPVFTIWVRFLHRALANDRQDEVLKHSANLPSVLARVEQRLSGMENMYVPGTKLTLQQDDLDAYVMAATPPTYDFLKVLQSRNVSNNGAGRPGHPLALQSELLAIGFQAIGDAWPELKEQILEVIKIIGYLPDATFRSCSATRYSGVVYLGNMDESVLDIEESLVHEGGHQVLYRVAEVTPLTQPDTPMEPTYVLPWSGSQRDLFGFLHAFYIYALLVKYYSRRASLGGNQAEDCRNRCRLITIGLRLAKPMLEGDTNLTELGRLMVQTLSTEVEALQESTASVSKSV